MAQSVFEKYAVNSKDELLEVLEELIFEESKKWKERLHIRPLRMKHLSRIQEISNEYLEIFGHSMDETHTVKWEKQENWVAQLRHFEKAVALGLTHVFQSYVPSQVALEASALSDYLTQFEDDLLKHTDINAEYSTEVNSRENLDSALCIHYFLEGKEDQALLLLSKEMKRLRTILK